MEKSHYTPAREEVYRPSIGRRLLVGAYALTLAMGGAKVAENVYDVWRQDLSNTVEDLTGREGERNHPDRAWIMVPGYGMSWMDSRDAAQFMRPELEKTGRMQWLGYSNEEFNIDDVAEVALEHVQSEGLKEVNLYGYSMGGPVSIELAKRFAEHDIDVGHIILDSSPGRLEDIKHTAVVSFVSAGGLSSLPWSVIGAATTKGATPVDFLRSNDDKNVSAPLLRGTASYLKEFDIQDAVEGLSPDIDFSYIGSANDERIYTDSAAKAYEEALPGNEFEVYDSYPAGHASPRGHQDIYLDIMKKVSPRVIDRACEPDSDIEMGAIEDLCPTPDDFIMPPGLTR